MGRVIIDRINAEPMVLQFEQGLGIASLVLVPD